jgi:hypothetical protein
MSDDSPSWRDALFASTAPGRYARASRHEAIADAEPHPRTSRALWHHGRARGQRDRPERVAACGDHTVMVACSSCGTVRGEPRDARCAGWRYCSICRGLRASRYREAIDLATGQWAQRKQRYERERFLTLTVPHSGDVADDTRLLVQSWSRFCRGLRRWLKRSRGVVRHVAFIRAVELTTSDGGHAHLHAWLGSPYLPHAVLRVLWGRALRGYVPVRLLRDALADQHDPRSREELLHVAGFRARRVVQYVPWPVIDIRAVPAGSVSEELAKYLVKDTTYGELADPAVVGACIEASEGVRCLGASRGLWVLRPLELCDCGATHYALVRLDGRRHEPGSTRFP